MDEHIVSGIVEGGGGLGYLRDLVLVLRRDAGDLLFDTTNADLIEALGTTSSTASRWSKSHAAISKHLFTAENMRRLAEAYDVDYVALMVGVGLLPQDQYAGDLPPFPFGGKKGGRSPIKRPRP